MGIDIPSASTEMEQVLNNALASAWQTLASFRVAAPQHADLFIYFRSLDDVLSTLSQSGRPEVVEDVMRHVDYLATKAGCHSAVLLGGGHFSTDPRIILDALANIGAVLTLALRQQPELPPEGMPADVFALIVEAEAKLAGWCSREKALLIAGTVLQEKPKICVEIGIFGGRSLVPCAAALRSLDSGVIYGIEAWSPEIAIQNPTNDVNDDWWSKIDFAGIKQEFFRFIAATGLTRHVRVIEAPSGRAASLFDEIDFLHIDGSHSALNAAEDVILYARKVRSGGIVVFDDVNWQSTAPARELLATFCDTTAVLKDPGTNLDICAMLRRR